MQLRTLDDLLKDGFIERHRPEPSRAQTWRERGRKDLEAARTLTRQYPERALAIAYEAALGACLGLLTLAGYRLRGAQGHHLAALQATASLDASLIPLLRRVDAARIFRNELLYGVPSPPDPAEVRQALADAETVLGEVARRIPQRGVSSAR